MAAVSSSQSSALTSQEDRGRGGAWNFSVPVSGEDQPSEEQPYSNPPANGTGYNSSASARPAQRRTNTLDSQGSGRSLQHQASGHLRSARSNQLSRKQSDLSISNHDTDGHHNHSSGHVRNGTFGAMGEKRKVTTSGVNGTHTEKEKDASNWIHRDKLAQIESRELEEAGFKVPRRVGRPESRGHSLASAERSQSRSRRATTTTQEEYVLLEEDSPPPADYNTLHSRYSSKDLKEDRRPKMATPVQTFPAEEEIVEMEQEDDRNAWDLRTPEEIASERERTYPHNRSHSRPGGSRLPLARDSPKPVPNVVVERDSPLTRSRQGSTAAGTSILEPAIVFTRPLRSGSFGSEVLFDDVEEPRTPVTKDSSSPSDVSPQKNRSPTKARPTSRKGPKERIVSTSKSRQTSATAKRPGTAEGVRPSTGHRLNRPEGEAPWLATMYKPDPSLPPDEQIIPTHAKRMAQEQWEKEGKTGSVYDTEFRLLNTEAFAKPIITPPKEQPPEKHEEDNQQWQLQPEPSPKLDVSRPGTSGGYKTIPTITSPQIPARYTPTPRPVNSPLPSEPARVEEYEDEKQKKGCCCIVM